MKKYFAFILLIMGVLFLTETWIKYVMNLWKPKGDMSAIFTFDFMANPNISYGIYIGSSFLQLRLIILIFLWLLYLTMQQYKRENIVIVIGLSLMITGASNNIFDRFLYGYVVDYISFFPQAPWGSFPTFNLADIFIFFGFLLILLESISKKIQTKNPQ